MATLFFCWMAARQRHKHKLAVSESRQGEVSLVMSFSLNYFLDKEQVPKTSGMALPLLLTRQAILLLQK